MAHVAVNAVHQAGMRYTGSPVQQAHCYSRFTIASSTSVRGLAEQEVRYSRLHVLSGSRRIRGSPELLRWTR